MKITTNLGQQVDALEADILWASLHAQSVVEDALQVLFDGPYQTWKGKNYHMTFSHIGYDSYDSSIELYVSEDARFDQDQLVETLKQYGFTFGWINFDDGSEIAFSTSYKPTFGKREMRECPRWNKEMSQKEEAGEQGLLPGWRPAFRRWLLESKGCLSNT